MSLWIALLIGVMGLSAAILLLIDNEKQRSYIDWGWYILWGVFGSIGVAAGIFVAASSVYTILAT